VENKPGKVGKKRKTIKGKKNDHKTLCAKGNSESISHLRTRYMVGRKKISIKTTLLSLSMSKENMAADLAFYGD